MEDADGDRDGVLTFEEYIHSYSQLTKPAEQIKTETKSQTNLETESNLRISTETWTKARCDL